MRRYAYLLAYFLLLATIGFAFGFGILRVGDFGNDRSIVWGIRTTDSPQELASWLAARGATYDEWASKHPIPAARLEGKHERAHVRLEWPPSVHGFERPSPPTIRPGSRAWMLAALGLVLLAAVVVAAGAAGRRILAMSVVRPVQIIGRLPGKQRTRAIGVTAPTGASAAAAGWSWPTRAGQALGRRAVGAPRLKPAERASAGFPRRGDSGRAPNRVQRVLARVDGRRRGVFRSLLGRLRARAASANARVTRVAAARPRRKILVSGLAADDIRLEIAGPPWARVDGSYDRETDDVDAEIGDGDATTQQLHVVQASRAAPAPAPAVDVMVALPPHPDVQPQHAVVPGASRTAEDPAPAVVLLTDSPTCEICVWHGYVTSQFYALGGDGERIVTASPYFRRAGHRPDRTEAALAAHQTLVRRLQEQGWQVDGAAPEWYALRLRFAPARQQPHAATPAPRAH